jgi:hypothetical protein
MKKKKIYISKFAIKNIIEAIREIHFRKNKFPEVGDSIEFSINNEETVEIEIIENPEHIIYEKTHKNLS